MTTTLTPGVCRDCAGPCTPPHARCYGCTDKRRVANRVAQALPDQRTYDGDTRRLVIRCALKGIPAGIVDRTGRLTIVRNLDQLAELTPTNHPLNPTTTKETA